MMTSGFWSVGARLDAERVQHRVAGLRPPRPSRARAELKFSAWKASRTAAV
jgi:hypothetical protein